MGSNPSTLLRVLARNGFVPPSRIPHVALALSAAAVRWPFSLLERAMVARLRREEMPVRPPLFIVGHWRSGTTHLYNVLSRDPDMAFVPPFATALPWDFLGLARWLQPLLERALPSNRFVDRIPVHADSPQEDEIALANMQPISFYHGLYFPSRFKENFLRGIFFDGCRIREIRRWEARFHYFHLKLALQQPGKRLLIKNPVYTARVAMLRKLWPGAKFLHIRRNPYEVIQSTRSFYRALFRELALQDWEEAPVDEVILSAYPRMLDALEAAARDLPPSDFVELRYEDVEADPLAEIERAYRRLELDGFERARPEFQAYLGSIHRYRKNTYEFSPAWTERIYERLKPYIDRWGYRPPGA